MARFILIFFLTGFCLATWAQEPYQFYVDGNLDKTSALNDSLEVVRSIRSQLTNYWSDGFLFADLDSIRDKKVFIHRGQVVQSSGNQVKIFDQETQDYKTELWKRPFSIVQEYANNGYPFVTFKLDSFSTSKENFTGYFSAQPGPQIRYDSIALLSKVAVNRSYLEDALGIQSGKLFSEKTYSAIEKKMDRIDFLELNQRPDIAFENGKSTVYLDLDEQSQNAFEGVIGFLPNQAENNRLAITGYLNLALANLFQSGIGLDVAWNRFANLSQTLDLNYSHPYFLTSSLMLDVNFNLVKQDTTFVTQTWDLGLGTYLGNRVLVRAGYSFVNGNLISNEVQQNGDLSNFKTNWYSLRLGSVGYTKPFGYRNGIRFLSAISAGDKRILNSQNTGNSDFSSLALNLKSELKYQLTIFKQAAFYHEVIGYGFFNDQIINNELARLGGLRSMRGFNENFFFAQHYFLSRFEIRQYFETKSFLMLFYDQMFYSFRNDWDQPVGFGLGLNLNTSNGLFTFAMAVGKTGQIPLNFANMKVHFGYTTTF